MSVKKTFSQRVSAEPDLPPRPSYISERLRNRLFNLLVPDVKDNDPSAKALVCLVYDRVYGFPTDEIDYTHALVMFRKAWLRGTWDECYAVAELIASASGVHAKALNEVLEEENSAYRFLAGEIVPIVAKEEREAIAAALSLTEEIGAAREHLAQAISCLAMRPTPDLRNAVKEAISAVEHIARKMTGKDNLGDALKELKNDLPPTLRLGFDKIYGWTNGPDGIRHAMMDDDAKIEIEDAQFMIVACSAFVSYLVAKAGRTGIDLKG